MSSGNGYLDLLKSTLSRLKAAVFDADTPPRDLAALTRRLLEVSREIERLETQSGGNESVAVEVGDDEFDEAAV
ncbi:hypothetical protein [Bifidobacterium bifidum]|uniref:hypothetical protein n=1 Tax=Bifidobacterium bifidum TaxID=1681 RepID=UPI003D06AB30